jgi:DNA polymerase/3'-5' exonuclease PolX
MSDIREVYGIGNKKAVDLIKHYNIRDVKTLRKYVRKIPGLVSDIQKISLKYHDKISKPISYKDASIHVKKILKIIPSATIAGSYRRKQKTIGDIDVIIKTNMKHTINKLVKAGYIIAELECGDKKFSGISKVYNSYRRIDIIYCTKEEYPFSLLYLTGDFVQNISMRQKAKKLKYSLSRYGLMNTKNNRYVNNIKTEEDIFKILNIKYKEPEFRSHNKFIKKKKKKKKI